MSPGESFATSFPVRNNGTTGLKYNVTGTGTGGLAVAGGMQYAVYFGSTATNTGTEAAGNRVGALRWHHADRRERRDAHAGVHDLGARPHPGDEYHRDDLRRRPAQQHRRQRAPGTDHQRQPGLQRPPADRSLMTTTRLLRGARETVLWTGALVGLLAVAAGFAVVVMNASFLVFRSGSMSPDIRTGALALATPVDARDIRPGDVVSVHAADGSQITHRVVSSTLRGDEASLVLRGDANSTPDAEVYVVRTAERVHLVRAVRRLRRRLRDDARGSRRHHVHVPRPCWWSHRSARRPRGSRPAAGTAADESGGSRPRSAATAAVVAVAVAGSAVAGGGRSPAPRRRSTTPPR